MFFARLSWVCKNDVARVERRHIIIHVLHNLTKDIWTA